MKDIDNKICVSLGNTDFHECIEAVNWFPLSEVRLDLLNLSISQIETVFAAGNKVIATCRPGKLNDTERLSQLIAAIEAGANYVDMDITNSSDFIATVSRIAIDQKCEIIYSYHNFKETPPLLKLKITTEKCFTMGANVAKIACMANSHNDLNTIYSLYNHYQNIIAFGLGSFGVESRIKSLQLGAEFTYASLRDDQATAPGQINFLKMKDALSKIVQ